MKTRVAAEKLQSLGRGGDTLLAHINPREAQLLRRSGGRGTRNPKTGLLEFLGGGGEGDGGTGAIGGDAVGGDTGGIAATDDGVVGEVTFSDGTTGQGLAGVTITGSPPASPAGDSDISFDMSMIPDADPRGGVGNMQGMPTPPPTFMENLLKKGQTLATNIAISKGIGAIAAATGIPGIAIAGIIAAANAGNNAPPGQSGSAVGNSVGNTVANAVTNTATGGISGALGMAGITMGSVFGSPTGPAGNGDTSGGSDFGGGAGGQSGGMAQPFSYSPAIDYLRGGYGLYQANKLAQLSKGTAAEQAAGGQLQSLISDPSSITKTPGYEAGLQAVQRAAAGKGYLASGNLSVALSKFGTDFYNNSLQTLDQIANRNAGIRQQNRNNSIALAGQALNSLGYGFGRSNRGAPVQSRPYTDAGMQDQANLYTEAPVEAPSDLGDFYG